MVFLPSGIRIGTPNNYNHFTDEVPEIVIDTDGIECSATLNPTFWGTCPEIQVARGSTGTNLLSQWIVTNNLLPPIESITEKGRKDVVILEVIEPYKKFRLYQK